MMKVQAATPGERWGAEATGAAPRSQGMPAPNESRFRDVVGRLGREIDRGEAVVSHALGSNPYSGDARGMIALQAGVYRYVEAMELFSRLVDRCAGAVKTTLQNQ